MINYQYLAQSANRLLQVIYIYVYSLTAIYDQQRDPFLQESAPAETVMEPIREDGRAPKLDALA